MKNLTWFIGAGGIVAYLVSIVIQITGTPQLLGASPSGWWRASISLIAIGMFLALTEIRNALRKE